MTDEKQNTVIGKRDDCDNEYIGQTKRQLSTCLKEHQKAVFFSNERKFSFIGAHMPNLLYDWVG